MNEINADKFEDEVLKAEGSVLVDFNATWCGPCRMMKPILEAFAKMHKDVKVVGVDIDENEELAEQYKVSTIPCLVVFKNGEEKAREIGVIPERKIVKMVEG